MPDSIDIYPDPIIAKYADLITAAMPGRFAAVYQGDPIRLRGDALPVLIVAKTRTRVGQFDNRRDQHEIGISITVVVDIRAEIGDDDIVPGIGKLYELVEGRQEDYSLKTDSVLHILRSNQVVDQANNLRTDLESITTVDYTLTLGKRKADTYALEARLDFIADLIQDRGAQTS